MTELVLSENQQSLSDVLERAHKEGELRIRRESGETFVLKREDRSPFDIEGVDLNLTRDEIVDFIREGRRGV